MTWTLPEPMLAAAVNSPDLPQGWAAEPKLWMGFRSVRCPLRAWVRALRCEGPWTSSDVGSGTVLGRGRERVVQALDAALRGDAEVTVSGIAPAVRVDRTFLYRHRDLLEPVHAAAMTPVMLGRTRP